MAVDSIGGVSSKSPKRCVLERAADYRGMPAPAAVPAVPLPGVEVEPGARVEELRFVLEPQAAEAETEIIEIARTVRMARVFFMAGSVWVIESLIAALTTHSAAARPISNRA